MSGMNEAAVLSFAEVSKTYPDGGRERVVLSHVSFEVGDGTFVGILGARRSGKTTLLRLAAGVELASSGSVRLNGLDLAKLTTLERERILRRHAALMSIADWTPAHGERVIDSVARSLGSSGPPLRDARHHARRVLGEVGLAAHADDELQRLSLVERGRVVLARAMVREPQLLLVDEPAVMPSIVEREEFFSLVRSMARARGMTLIVSSEEIAPLHGADVLMSISDGEVLCSSERHSGDVVPLSRRRQAS